MVFVQNSLCTGRDHCVHNAGHHFNNGNYSPHECVLSWDKDNNTNDHDVYLRLPTYGIISLVLILSKLLLI